MSNFCSSCGATTGGGKFCPKCGAVQTGAAPAAAQASYAPVPAKSGSPALKIVLIILGVFIFVGIAGSVGAYYFVKGKVQEIAQSNGGKNWREAVSNAHAEPTHAGCDLIGKDKVAEILGTSVNSVNGNEAGDAKEFCNYWAQADGGAAPAKKTDDDNRDSSSKSKDGPATMKDLQDLAKTVSSAYGAGALLNVQVFRGTAKVALMGLRTASMFTGKKQEPIEGPWDEAYFGPFDAMLFVRKGDNGAMLDLHKIPQPHEKGLELAKAAIEGL